MPRKKLRDGNGLASPILDMPFRFCARSLAPLTLVPLVACLSPPVAAPRTTVTQESNVRVERNIKNKVDVLFMVDNSSSMDPMQLELRTRFGDFFKVFEDLAADGTSADLHIGVVTSDFGAGDTAGGGCDTSGGGQHGFLQTLPSPNATSPPPNCMPPVGAPYIAYAFDPNGGPARTNLPNGTSAAALVSEFTCMASVGAKGCGFEHQLESVYAALHNTKENAGFLRSEALLTVVFVTNEDDGSAPPSAKFYEQAGSDPTGGGMYGQYTTYRQTRFAVDCGGMPIPYGMPIPSLTNCGAAPNPMAADVNTAYDISRYIDYFTKPAKFGGVKVDPADVILVGIDGPENHVETKLVDTTKGNTPYVDLSVADVVDELHRGAAALVREQRAAGILRRSRRPLERGHQRGERTTMSPASAAQARIRHPTSRLRCRISPKTSSGTSNQAA